MKTMIAIPCMDEIDVGFVESLIALKHVGDVTIKFLSGSLIYEAREQLAATAVNNDFDYVLWLDSDQMFKPTMMLDFVASDVDMVSGVIPARRPPYCPVVYKREGDKLIQMTEFEDRLFEIDACGFGAVFMKTEILQKSFEMFGTCFMPVKGFGEDLSFCLRAKELGYKMYADPRIDFGHIGKIVITKKDYKPNVSKD